VNLSPHLKKPFFIISSQNNRKKRRKGTSFNFNFKPSPFHKSIESPLSAFHRVLMETKGSYLKDLLRHLFVGKPNILVEQKNSVFEKNDN
jgi:hypothetical protein